MNNNEFAELQLEFSSAKLTAKICERVENVTDFISKASYLFSGIVSLVTVAIVSSTILRIDINDIMWNSEAVIKLGRLQNIVSRGGIFSIGFLAGGFITRKISDIFHNYTWAAHYKMDNLIEKAKSFEARKRE